MVGLVEVLVCLKDGTILIRPTDLISQAALSVTILDIYITSVSGVSLPLHSCWATEVHLDHVQLKLYSAFSYVFKNASFC